MDDVRKMRRTALYAQLRPELVSLHARISGRGLNAVGTICPVATGSMLQSRCMLLVACCMLLVVRAHQSPWLHSTRAACDCWSRQERICVTQGSKWSCELYGYSQCAVVLAPPPAPEMSPPCRCGSCCGVFCHTPRGLCHRMRCLHGTPMSRAKRRRPTRSRSAQRTGGCAT